MIPILTYVTCAGPNKSGYHHVDVSEGWTGGRDYLPPWCLHGPGGQGCGGEAEGTAGGHSEGGPPGQSKPDSEQSCPRDTPPPGMVIGGGLE